MGQQVARRQACQDASSTGPPRGLHMSRRWVSEWLNGRPVRMPPQGSYLLRRGASKVQRDSIVTLQCNKCSSLPQKLLAVLLQDQHTL